MKERRRGFKCETNARTYSMKVNVILPVERRNFEYYESCHIYLLCLTQVLQCIWMVFFLRRKTGELIKNHGKKRRRIYNTRKIRGCWHRNSIPVRSKNSSRPRQGSISRHSDRFGDPKKLSWLVDRISQNTGMPYTFFNSYILKKMTFSFLS